MTATMIYAVSYIPEALLTALILLTLWDIHSTSESLTRGCNLVKKAT
jgi:MFS superfamily sulfate permease-like transporter